MRASSRRVSRKCCVVEPSFLQYTTNGRAAYERYARAAAAPVSAPGSLRGHGGRQGEQVQQQVEKAKPSGEPQEDGTDKRPVSHYQSALITPGLLRRVR
jgi:hypothetical protein